MKKKSETKETQTFKAGTLDNVGQTTKPMDPTGPAIDETVRQRQTGAWTLGDNPRYAPTSHTSNKLTKMVLDPMPSPGKEANDGNTVSGSAIKVLGMGTDVAVRKQVWDSKQPERTFQK